jgi:hypothetical protein
MVTDHIISFDGIEFITSISDDWLPEYSLQEMGVVVVYELCGC